MKGFLWRFAAAMVGYWSGYATPHFAKPKPVAAPAEWHRYARDRFQDKTGAICGESLDRFGFDEIVWFPDMGCKGEKRYVFTEHIMTQGGDEARKLRDSGWVAE